MSDNDNEWPPPTVTIGYALAAAIVLLPLAYALRIILLAIGTAVGLAIATATTGLSTAGSVGTWVAPLAAVGLGTSGAVCAVHLAFTFNSKVKDKPYEWTLPLLGLIGGLMITLWKDVASTSTHPFFRLLIGGIATLWIVIAGACYKRPGAAWKSTAAAMYFLPPLIMIAALADNGAGNSLYAYLSAIPVSQWILVIGFVIMGGIIAVLERLTRDPYDV